MKVILASDHGGIHLSKEIASLLEEQNIEYEDIAVIAPIQSTTPIMAFRLQSVSQTESLIVVF